MTTDPIKGALVAAMLMVAPTHAVHAATITWDGNGNANNSGSWNTGANWDTGTIPGAGDRAILPEVTTGVRTVTVDSAVSIVELDWDPDQDIEDYLILNANLTVGDLKNINHRNSRLNVNGYTFSITNSMSGGTGNWGQWPRVYSNGYVVKEGTFTFYMQHDDDNIVPFPGQVTVNNGVLQYDTYPRLNWGAALVNDGGTIAYNNAAFQNNPPPVTIIGDGYNGSGAVRFMLTRNQKKPITLAADASIAIDSGKVLYMENQLIGNYDLTIKGGGEFSISATITACTNTIIITNATMTVPAELTYVTNITIKTGGVLNGTTGHFPNATVIVDGGTWNNADTSIMWSGNGDPNNSGNWSDANNWYGGVPPGTGDVALLPEVSSGTRYVTVDTAVVVQELNWDPDQDNEDYVVLEADLTVGDLNYIHEQNSKLNVNGHTFTVANGISGGSGNWAQFPATFGTGTIVKDGTFTFSFQHGVNNPFTGEFNVSNGTLYYLPSPRQSWGTAVAENGATITYGTASASPPPPTISGPGYNGNGALNFVTTRDQTEPITLAADATIRIDTGITVSMKAPIDGCYTLTIKGGGELSIDSEIPACAGMMIIITNATLSVPTELTNVSNITIKADGVLNGSSLHFPNADVVLDGGIWNDQAGVAGWRGNGNPNNGGNWSDTNNWYGFEVPTNKAILSLVAGSVMRVITVDTATAVATLDWNGTPGDMDRIKLFANLTVNNFKGYHNTPNCRLYMNGHTVTVVDACADWAFCYPYETGTIVKQGTWQWNMEFVTAPGYTGEWRVENGTMYWKYYNRLYNSSVRVENGGTLQTDSSSYCYWQALTLNGPGYNNGGALYTTRPYTNTRPITIASDATIRTDFGETMGLASTLDGSGIITLVGGGTLDLNESWTYKINGSSANGIVVSAGNVDITGCTLSATNIPAGTAPEYVIIDYSSSNGVSTGVFAATNGIRPGWIIDYDGTARNPNSVVLDAAPMGTVLSVK